jgi:hypothetical protein
MDVLITLALILSLLSTAVVGLLYIEEELLRRPTQWMPNDCEDDDL